MDLKLKIKKLREGATLPYRATEGSAGMDLYACIDEEKTIAPGEILLIPTGIAIEIPSPDYVAYIFARSGLAIKHGVTLANSVGVVDSDYRGEVCVGLCNVGNTPYTIAPKERIAQMVISPVSLMPTVEVQELSDTERGKGGFGSTGKK
ncbi:MAG: dUTP diphosphatase [Eubacteriales bacterium]|nr:dUTP diphosphatase [Eubacteriales bacterium]